MRPRRTGTTVKPENTVDDKIKPDNSLEVNDPGVSGQPETPGVTTRSVGGDGGERPRDRDTAQSDSGTDGQNGDASPEPEYDRVTGSRTKSGEAAPYLDEAYNRRGAAGARYRSLLASGAPQGEIDAALNAYQASGRVVNAAAYAAGYYGGSSSRRRQVRESLGSFFADHQSAPVAAPRIDVSRQRSTVQEAGAVEETPIVSDVVETAAEAGRGGGRPEHEEAIATNTVRRRMDEEEEVEIAEEGVTTTTPAAAKSTEEEARPSNVGTEPPGRVAATESATDAPSPKPAPAKETRWDRDRRKAAEKAAFEQRNIELAQQDLDRQQDPRRREKQKIRIQKLRDRKEAAERHVQRLERLRPLQDRINQYEAAVQAERDKISQQPLPEGYYARMRAERRDGRALRRIRKDLAEQFNVRSATRQLSHANRAYRDDLAHANRRAAMARVGLHKRAEAAELNRMATVKAKIDAGILTTGTEGRQEQQPVSTETTSTTSSTSSPRQSSPASGGQTVVMPGTGETVNLGESAPEAPVEHRRAAQEAREKAREHRQLGTRTTDGRSYADALEEYASAHEDIAKGKLSGRYAVGPGGVSQEPFAAQRAAFTSDENRDLYVDRQTRGTLRSMGYSDGQIEGLSSERKLGVIQERYNREVSEVFEKAGYTPEQIGRLTQQERDAVLGNELSNQQAAHRATMDRVNRSAASLGTGAADTGDLAAERQTIIDYNKRAASLGTGAADTGDLAAERQTIIDYNKRAASLGTGAADTGDLAAERQTIIDYNKRAASLGSGVADTGDLAGERQQFLDGRNAAIDYLAADNPSARGLYENLTAAQLVDAVNRRAQEQATERGWTGTVQEVQQSKQAMDAAAQKLAAAQNEALGFIKPGHDQEERLRAITERRDAAQTAHAEAEATFLQQIGYTDRVNALQEARDRRNTLHANRALTAGSAPDRAAVGLTDAQASAAEREYQEAEASLAQAEKDFDDWRRANKVEDPADRPWYATAGRYAAGFVPGLSSALAYRDATSPDSPGGRARTESERAGLKQTALLDLPGVALAPLTVVGTGGQLVRVAGLTGRGIATGGRATATALTGNFNPLSITRAPAAINNSLTRVPGATRRIGSGLRGEGIEEGLEAGYEYAITGQTNPIDAAGQAAGFGTLDALDPGVRRRRPAGPGLHDLGVIIGEDISNKYRTTQNLLEAAKRKRQEDLRFSIDQPVTGSQRLEGPASFEQILEQVRRENRPQGLADSSGDPFPGRPMSGGIDTHALAAYGGTGADVRDFPAEVIRAIRRKRQEDLRFSVDQPVTEAQRLQGPRSFDQILAEARRETRQEAGRSLMRDTQPFALIYDEQGASLTPTFGPPDRFIRNKKGLYVPGVDLGGTTRPQTGLDIQKDPGGGMYEWQDTTDRNPYGSPGGGGVATLSPSVTSITYAVGSPSPTVAERPRAPRVATPTPFTDIPVDPATGVPDSNGDAFPDIGPNSSSVAVPTRRTESIPSIIPTPVPTPVPTARPAVIPTQAPSVAPMPAPTAVPTVSPSPSPTVAPSPSPAPTPSLSPSPSPSPTVAPSPSPSLTPTPAPSPSPSATPTPTPALTPSPSFSFSAIPTPSATIIPRAAATVIPAPVPTAVPGATPVPAVTPSPPVFTPTPTPSPTPRRRKADTDAGKREDQQSTDPTTHPHTAVIEEVKAIDPRTGNVIDEVPLTDTLVVTSRGPASTHGAAVDAGSVVVHSRDRRARALVEPGVDSVLEVDPDVHPDAITIRERNTVDLRTGQVLEEQVVPPETQSPDAAQDPEAQPIDVTNLTVAERMKLFKQGRLRKVAGAVARAPGHAAAGIREGSATGLEALAGGLTEYQTGREEAAAEAQARRELAEAQRQAKEKAAAEEKERRAAQSGVTNAAEDLTSVAARIRAFKKAKAEEAGETVEDEEQSPSQEDRPQLTLVEQMRSFLGGKANGEDQQGGQAAAAVEKPPSPSLARTLGRTLGRQTAGLAKAPEAAPAGGGAKRRGRGRPPGSKNKKGKKSGKSTAPTIIFQYVGPKGQATAAPRNEQLIKTLFGQSVATSKPKQSQRDPFERMFG